MTSTTTYSRKTSDIFISEKFRNLIDQFKDVSQVAKSLILKRASNDILIDNHINYICISESDPTKISYLTPDRISKIESSSLDDYWTSTQRFHCKPGSFIGKILKDISSKEVEKFSNLFKSFSNKQEFSFEVVSGSKIVDYYNYEIYASQNGTLGASCMKYNKCQDYFDLYKKNPDNISMLIMKNPSNFITGRALLWNFTDEISGQSFKIMDRIYTISDEWEFLFKKWASDNEYLYKSKQNWGNTIQFENNSNPQIELKLGIKIKSFLHKFYPYVDTFKWIDMSNGIIYNYLPDHFKEDSLYHRLLVMADGRYESTRYLGFDELDRNWIYKADLVYLEEQKIWTSIGNCRWVDSMGRYVLQPRQAK